jgi:hypothetical protein
MKKRDGVGKRMRSEDEENRRKRTLNVMGRRVMESGRRKRRGKEKGSMKEVEEE